MGKKNQTAGGQAAHRMRTGNKAALGGRGGTDCAILLLQALPPDLSAPGKNNKLPMTASMSPPSPSPVHSNPLSRPQPWLCLLQEAQQHPRLSDTEELLEPLPRPSFRGQCWGPLGAYRSLSAPPAAVRPVRAATASVGPQPRLSVWNSTPQPLALCAVNKHSQAPPGPGSEQAAFQPPTTQGFCTPPPSLFSPPCLGAWGTCHRHWGEGFRAGRIQV